MYKVENKVERFLLQNYWKKNTAAAASPPTLVPIKPQNIFIVTHTRVKD